MSRRRPWLPKLRRVNRHRAHRRMIRRLLSYLLSREAGLSGTDLREIARWFLAQANRTEGRFHG